MTPVLLLALLAGPIALMAVAALASFHQGPRPRRLLAAAEAAALMGLASSVLAVLIVAAAGPLRSPLLGLGEVGLSLRLDALSATMALLVAFVGAAVIRFARNYLDGDPRQGAFTGWLCATLAAVLLLALAGNLIQLVVAWIATSLALNRLLLFYPDRPGAVNAARKKFFAARLGDLCLIAAAVLLFRGFGSADITTIIELARGMDPAAASPGTAVAAMLLALAALFKSAQFPLHGWLTQVMETPTPVSALLHAGIVNAGGFLVLRFADVMLLNASALHLLAIMGGLTALFGAAVMLTKPSVKVALAWSTVSQMGFMLLQCGLGLFALALLHIVAHSLYKAHAFLSSGGAVRVSQAGPRSPRPARFVVGMAITLPVYVALSHWLGLADTASVQLLLPAAVLAMGVAILLSQTSGGRSMFARLAGLACLVTLSSLLLHAGASTMTASTLPPVPTPDGAGAAIAIFAVLSLAFMAALQLAATEHAAAPIWRRIRIHLANGLYADAVVDRLLGPRTSPAHEFN